MYKYQNILASHYLHVLLCPLLHEDWFYLYMHYVYCYCMKF